MEKHCVIIPTHPLHYAEAHANLLSMLRFATDAVLPRVFIVLDREADRHRLRGGQFPPDCEAIGSAKACAALASFVHTLSLEGLLEGLAHGSNLLDKLIQTPGILQCRPRLGLELSRHAGEIRDVPEEPLLHPLTKLQIPPRCRQKRRISMGTPAVECVCVYICIYGVRLFVCLFVCLFACLLVFVFVFVFVCMRTSDS